MMKTLIAALALAASAPVAAQWSVQISGVSHHASSAPFRETNPGLGLRYQLDPAWSLHAGFFQNSFDRHSNFALVQWEPLAIGPVRVGLFAGYASGYELRVPAVAGLMMTTQTAPLALTLRLIPGIGKHTTVLSAEVGFRF